MGIWLFPFALNLHYGGKTWLRKVWDSWCILKFITSTRKQRCKSVAVFLDLVNDMFIFVLSHNFSKVMSSFYSV